MILVYIHICVCLHYLWGFDLSWRWKCSAMNLKQVKGRDITSWWQQRQAKMLPRNRAWNHAPLAHPSRFITTFVLYILLNCKCFLSFFLLENKIKPEELTRKIFKRECLNGVYWFAKIKFKNSKICQKLRLICLV